MHQIILPPCQVSPKCNHFYPKFFYEIWTSLVLQLAEKKGFQKKSCAILHRLVIKGLSLVFKWNTLQVIKLFDKYLAYFWHKSWKIQAMLHNVKSREKDSHNFWLWRTSWNLSVIIYIHTKIEWKIKPKRRNQTKKIASCLFDSEPLLG